MDEEDVLLNLSIVSWSNVVGVVTVGLGSCAGSELRLVIGRSIAIAVNKPALTTRKKMIVWERLIYFISGFIMPDRVMSFFITLHIPL